MFGTMGKSMGIDLLAIGYWLLAIGCWLLAVGCWLLAVGCALDLLIMEEIARFDSLTSNH